MTKFCGAHKPTHVNIFVRTKGEFFRENQIKLDTFFDFISFQNKMLFIQLAIITLFSSSAFAIFAGQNDPRIERWNRMKIALPDNLTPEDEVLAPAQVLPSSRRPLYREQYNEPLGYKHLGLPPAIKQVAPLPPSAVKHQGKSCLF